MSSHVLIIDDEPSVCWALEKFLVSRGLRATAVASAEQGLVRIQEERPDLVLLDVQLPGMSGLDALLTIRATGQAPPVIVITAHGTMDTAIEAMRRGAFDYLTKPIDLAAADEVVRRALTPLERAEVPGGGGDVRLVGSSQAMQRVYKQIGILSASDATVLVHGESGTGKELLARMLHRTGLRQHGPFEPLVCASLPASLLESELFGHETGAFTGAIGRRVGRIERADGGTLLLDEVSEIPLESQVKLLRFLQERTIERIGGGEEIAVDVRVIAATNRPLGELVAAGRFREDLYYRLKVVEIELPPLRRRAADIPELVGAFLAITGHEAGISSEALEILRGYYWPGNVRELRHAIDHALALARGAMIAPGHLPPYLGQGSFGQVELAGHVRSQLEAELAADPDARELHARLFAKWESALLALTLDHTGGNQVRAARMLGIARGTLRRRLRKYGLLDGGEGGA